MWGYLWNQDIHCSRVRCRLWRKGLTNQRNSSPYRPTSLSLSSSGTVSIPKQTNHPNSPDSFIVRGHHAEHMSMLYSRPSLLSCSAATAISGVSVCLSVCLSHAGNASKLMNVGSRGFTDEPRDQLSYSRPQRVLALTLEIPVWKSPTQSCVSAVRVTAYRQQCAIFCDDACIWLQTRRRMLLAADQTQLVLSAISQRQLNVLSWNVILTFLRRTGLVCRTFRSWDWTVI